MGNAGGILEEKLKVPRGRECLTPNRDYAHGRLTVGHSKRDHNLRMAHTWTGTPLKRRYPVNIPQWVRDDPEWMTTWG